LRLVVRDELCSGCRACENVCALSNLGENNPKKARLRVKGEFPWPGRYKVIVCDQCGKCAEACPVECIEQVDGVYRINVDECTGCLVCVDACPTGAMFTHPSEESPFKCTACGECVELCPREALSIEGGKG